MSSVDYLAELVAFYGRFEVELNPWITGQG